METTDSRRSVTFIGDEGCAPIALTTTAAEAFGSAFERSSSWETMSSAAEARRSAAETQVPPNLWTCWSWRKKEREKEREEVGVESKKKKERRFHEEV